MVTVVPGQPPSTEIRARLKAENRPVLVAFSGGKDAIATNLALRDAGIETHLSYLLYIPGRELGRTLDFVEQSLADLEREFGQTIHRYPHPSLYRWLNAFMFQPPERIETIRAAAFPVPKYEEIWALIRQDLGLAPDTWLADGVRAADSIVRRTSFTTHGAMKEGSRKVSPIFDWRKHEVLDRIAAAGIKLPVDYELFKRSFDGLDYRFLKPISEAFPRDYEQILEWFPLCELELTRHDIPRLSEA